MATVISIALQKGGTGKSTTALALASTLGFKRKKVLAVDMDPQASMTYFSGVDIPQYSLFDVFNEQCTLDRAIIKCPYYDLLAAGDDLVRVNITSKAGVFLLKDEIDKINGNYDYVIIDTPPGRGNLLYNSLVASDYVIIPLQPRPASLHGLWGMAETIRMVQEENKDLRVLGILFIKYSNRTILARSMSDEITKFAKEMNTVVFETTIREGIAAAEAMAMRKPLIDYAPSSKPTIDYKGFTTEVLKMTGGFKDGNQI